MKVWGKGLIRRWSKGCGDGTQSSANFTIFLNITPFTACFGLKFLLKCMFLNCTAKCVCVSVV